MNVVSEFTESKVHASIVLIRELGLRIWDETHSLDQVLENMLLAMQQTKSVESWYAARVYCYLALVNGSEAHRVCDADFTRALLQIMRLNSAPNASVLLKLSETQQRRKSRKSFPSDRMQVDDYCSSEEEEDDEDYDSKDDKLSKKKRARASMSAEVMHDWSMLFQAMVRLDGYLDELERIEVFIHFGVKLNSAECIVWFAKQQHKDDEAVEYLLHALLQEAISTLNGNAMEANNSEWFFRALCALTNKQEYYLLAFCQRLALQCEVTTQAQRTRLIDFLQLCCGGGGGECKKRMEAFVCMDTFHAHAKATKRLLACDLLAMFTAGAKPCNRVLQVLCARTRDESAAVRCAAFRSLAQLAQTHNVLLVQNSHVLSSAIEAAQYDAKPIVRRWAVKILTLVPEFNPSVVQCCVDRLKDVSPICRKTALDTLGLILHGNKVNGKLVEALRTGVLLSCQDEDTAIRKQAVDICRSLLCQCGDDDLHDYLFAIRSPVEIQCLKLALASHGPKDNAVLRDLQHRMIQCAIDTLPSEDAPVNRPMVWSSWLLLCITFDNNSEVLPSEKLLSSDFLFTAWQRVRDMLSLSETDPMALEETHALQQRVCRLLGLCAARLTLEQKNDLGNTLLCDLSELTRAPVLCTEMLHTLVILSQFDCDNAEQIIKTWSLALKQCCEQYLLAVNKEAVKVDNALFLLGELALLGGNMQATHVRFTNNEEEEEDACVTLVQAFCSPDFVAAEQNLNSRAFALVALGKLCLCDAVLAKRCMVLFVKQLGNGECDNFVLRCNVLTILGDLGKKYTNLIEPFVDEQISTCLGDENVQVRFRCLQMLANLLSEEYIKMRPRLFYRILACLADSNSAVSALAQDICVAFHTKEPLLFFHLAGSNMVLAMNNQSTLMVGNANTVLVGVQHTFLNPAAARLAVYTFMLSRQTDVQVLECGNKVRRDVWGALLDGTIGLECVDVNSPVLSSASRIVLDVFTLLEHVTRVGGSRKTAVDGGGDDEDENELANSQTTTRTISSSVEKATSKVLDSLERTNIANNVLPMLISLYHISSKDKSSLVKPILQHFDFLYERFKPECATALAPHRDIQALLKIKKPAAAVAATPARRKRGSCIV